MIFPKQFLAESIERKALQQSYQTSPYETTYKNGDKSPFDLVMMNYYTFFDVKSSEMKELVRSARKEITQKCFPEEDMNTIPNGDRIQECIKRINHKVYGKHFDMRNVYYGNSKLILTISFI